MGIVQDTFGEGGHLAQQLDGYQVRDGQVRLAERVLATMEEGGSLLAEAPTGTGKSLAYALPAVWHAVQNGRKAVLVTANIALQDQLAKKDLPLLAAALPFEFNFQVLKGVANYLCLDVMDESNGSPSLNFDRREEHEQWDAIKAWTETTPSGDIAELPFEPLHRVRERFTVSSDDCLGVSCPFRDGCHLLSARRKAADADLVVTNYHLFFADLAIKAGDGQGVLPPYQHVVFDEGHKIADIVRDFFGWRVSRPGIKQATSQLKKGRRGAKGIDRELYDRIELEADFFFGKLAQFYHSDDYAVRLRGPGEYDAEQLAASLDEAASTLQVAADQGRFKADRKAELRNGANRCAAAASHLREGQELQDETRAYFLDERNDRVAVAMKPVDVAPILRQHVFESEKVRTTVVTSATLSTGGSSGFDFIAKQLGAESSADIEVESPFDFSGVTMVVPRGIAVPNAKAFPSDVAEALVETVGLARGRTLGLFTSYRVMKVAAQALRGAGLPYRILVQGEGSRMQLVRDFKEDVPSVLLGVESFWQGLDCPGETLSCVFIDKLPFAVPDDPVLSMLEQREGSRFWKRHSLPHAIIAFKQGFGRLVRTVSDAGAVVCCDRRLVDKPYGKSFFRALPEGVRVVRQLEEVANATR